MVNKIGNYAASRANLNTDKLNELAKSNRAEASQKTSENKGTNKSNVVSSLSEDSKIMTSATNALKNVPDIRQEKVDKLRSEIKAGTYKPDSEEVAKSVLKNIFSENSDPNSRTILQSKAPNMLPQANTQSSVLTKVVS